MKKLFTFLSWGRGASLPQAVQRKVYFNGILLSVSILFVLIMLGVEAYFRSWEVYPVFCASLAAYGFALYLNRRGSHTVSRVMLPAISLLLVFSLVIWKLNPTVLWFYMVVAIASITLFTYREKVFSIALISLCVVLFIISFIWLFRADALGVPTTYGVVIFLISYVMCLSASIVIVFIPIRHEYYAEQRLREMADELRDKQRKYEVVHSASGAILYEYDMINNYVPPNAQVNRMLGYEPSELRGYTFEESAQLIHPEDQQKFIGKITEALANSDAISLEYRVKNKAGEYIWVSAASVIERDENNRPTWMIGSLLNINDRKIVEEKVIEQNQMLTKANAELDNFVYHVSHDVRAPLSSILGLVNLAKRCDNNEELRQFISMMGDRANALDKFIHDVLAYSRNSRSSVHPTKVKLGDLLHEISEDLDYMENKSNIRIDINVPERLELMCDSHRWRVVFSNLLSNSIKYYSPVVTESYVRIGYQATETHHIITLEDNGRGIHEEYLPRIFEMFFRATDASTGSGIGLYIVKEVMEKLQGHLEVQSEVGVGTTFTLHFPITQDINEPSDEVYLESTLTKSAKTG